MGCIMLTVFVVFSGTSVEKSTSCVWHLQSSASTNGSLSSWVASKDVAWDDARWMKLVLFKLAFLCASEDVG